MTDQRSPIIGAWRQSPVLLVVHPTAADLGTFPADQVEALRPPAGRVGVGVVLGLVLAALVAVVAHAGPGAVPAIAGAGAAVVALAVYLRGHPVAYVIGAVLGAVAALLPGGSVVVAVVAAVVLLVLAWFARLGYAARRQWWPRLEALLTEHRPADGVLEVRGVAGSGFPHRYLLTATSPDVPGRSWTVEEVASRHLQPRTGDPVRIWFRPADPDAAVLAVSSDQVGMQARLAEDPRAGGGTPGPV
ncbi:hypothetical protein [Cellulomonas sp. Marseille-Q8402]